MNKLKCFGREHVVANISPMPGNRAFIDRTGRKYRVQEGVVIVRHYYGYNQNRASWWCEIEDMPGNFVLKPSYILSPRSEVEAPKLSVKSTLTGKTRIEKPSSMEEWHNITKELTFGGHPVLWKNGDFWLSTKGIKDVSEQLYWRVRDKCNIKSCREFGYYPKGTKGRTPGFVKLLAVQSCLDGRYNQVGKAAAPLLEAYRRLDALKKQHAVLSIAKREEVIEQRVEQPVPKEVQQVAASFEVDLREYTMKITKDFFMEKGITPTEEMLNTMSKELGLKFWRTSLKRRVLVDPKDVDGCFDAEMKLDAVLKLIKN
uniref:Uncharacterized protein n=1 Tax=Salmonella phage vB_SEnST11_KE23 TaxID=3161174 RepID=A0AAU8GFY1_9CAUD